MTRIRAFAGSMSEPPCDGRTRGSGLLGQHEFGCKQRTFLVLRDRGSLDGSVMDWEPNGSGTCERWR
ncbi:hypothetical protein [Sphingomonas desiccabilis]|uniref:Uncharacterized protein n=1 Tax=Sphingomonas desiccabilis TaxID=429134 RepID=A0A4Q2IL15_9SPHN|nr:hypothetical protein [Sphingomonas desiccabilis]MBB3912610.1 hypothetical protein [Sphingomonas desiccabilis]RXZ29897.1 hypothetical protein EO081_16270 [Sphingomonas desiccabilis]